MDRRNPGQVIQRLRAPEAENDFIDFKRACSTGRDLGQGRIDPGDRAQLAMVLSGFANTMGGVIVWGIDCKGTDKPEERASRLCVPGLGVKAVEFASKLQELVSDLAYPPVSGVEFAPIALGSGKDALAMFVPAVNHGPVRALAGIGRYFFRAGESFVDLPHGLLASMFGRRLVPRIHAQLVVKGRQAVGIGKDGAIHVSCEIFLHNVGMATAVECFMSLTCDLPSSESSWDLVPRDGDRFDDGGVAGVTVYLVARDGIRLPPRGVARPCELDLKLLGALERDFVLSIETGAAGALPLGRRWIARRERIAALLARVQAGETVLQDEVFSVLELEGDSGGDFA